MEDTRTLSQVAKSVATMRKKIAAAVKRYQKIQERISALHSEGRVIRLHKDAKVVHGDHCLYIKAESLNLDLFADWNWYYVMTEVAGLYSCSCEARKECKHINDVIIRKQYEEGWLLREKLESAKREQDAKRVAHVAMFDPCLVA